MLVSIVHQYGCVLFGENLFNSALGGHALVWLYSVRRTTLAWMLQVVARMPLANHFVLEILVLTTELSVFCSGLHFEVASAYSDHSGHVGHGCVG